MRKLKIFLWVMLFAVAEAGAQTSEVVANSLLSETVTSESAGRFLPMKRRFDREINKNKFVYKGEVLLGVTASYGTLSSDNSDLLLILEHIDANGAMTTVKPYVGYAYRDNRVIGLRFGYRHIRGDLGNLSLNLGEQNDISLSLSNMGYDSDNFDIGLYHRSYASIDARGRFGVFADIEAAVMMGNSTFNFLSGEAPKRTRSNNFKAELSFNPGVAVYIFPNVCGTLSFGLGGVQYTRITQKDDAGATVGLREASKMRFRLNLAEINLGFTIHLWNKKKE